jgi:hypothetical protein
MDKKDEDLKCNPIKGTTSILELESVKHEIKN